MTEQELQQLRSDIKRIDFGVATLVVLLVKKGIITTNEWMDGIHEVVDVCKEEDA